MRGRLRGIVAGLAALIATAGAPARAANVPGTSAQLAWGAASGPVAGYAVEVARSGGAFREELRVSGTSARVGGRLGETIVVRVLAYDANGRLGPASAVSPAITFVAAPPTGSASIDLDGNGLADALAVSPATGALAAALLRTDGSRQWVALGGPRDPGMRPAGLADADADGRADLLLRDAATGANELWLMHGLTYSVVTLPAQAPRFRVAAFRDFTGDGRADVFFHDGASGQSVVWTLGAAGTASPLAVDPAPPGTTLAAVADVDGDRAPDLVWENSASLALDAWLLRGVTPRAVVALGAAPAGARVEGVGDLDANGSDDLVWRVPSGMATNVHVWFLAGANAPRKGVALRLGTTGRLRGVADVNSDGRDDLIVGSSAGSSAFAVLPTLATPVPPQWTTSSIALTGVPTGSWQFLALD